MNSVMDELQSVRLVLVASRENNLLLAAFRKVYVLLYFESTSFSFGPRVGYIKMLKCEGPTEHTSRQDDQVSCHLSALS
jgi:hypothetical protein